jgi:hypothetical protein
MIESTAVQTSFAVSKRMMLDPELSILLQYLVIISLSRTAPTSGLTLSHIVVMRRILEEETPSPPKPPRAAIMLADGAVIRLSNILWR